MFDRIVAVVDHDPILLSELDRAARPFMLTMEKQVTDDVQRVEARAKLLREMLDQLVDRLLVMRVAMKKGVMATEADIDSALESVAKQNNLTRAQILIEVEKTNMTEKEYRAELAYQIVETRLLVTIAQGKIETSDPKGPEKLARMRKDWLNSLRSEAYIEVRL